MPARHSGSVYVAADNVPDVGWGQATCLSQCPLAAQCVVLNVGTCAALSAAVREGKPIIDRIVTFAGRVAKPCNLRVRIGVPLLDVLDQVGGMTEGVRKLIVGGPMMGKTIPDLNVPI